MTRRERSVSVASDAGVRCALGALVLGAFGVAATLAGGGRVSRPHAVQQLRIEVTHAGFVPARKVLRRGVPAVIVFIRRTEQTCGTDAPAPLVVSVPSPTAYRWT